MKFLLIFLLLLTGCIERCIPFSAWETAVLMTMYTSDYQDNINYNVWCERAKKSGSKCQYRGLGDMPTHEDFAKEAGYPGVKYVCENDNCGLPGTLFHICLGKK